MTPEAAKQKKADLKDKDKQKDEGIAVAEDSRGGGQTIHNPHENLDDSKKRQADEPLNNMEEKKGRIDQDGVGILNTYEPSMESGDSERFFEAIDDSAAEADEDSNEDNDDPEPMDKDEEISIFGITDYNEKEDRNYNPLKGLKGPVDVVRNR